MARRKRIPVDELRESLPRRLRRFDPSEWPPCPIPMGRNDTCTPGAHQQELWISARGDWFDEHMPGPGEIGDANYRLQWEQEQAEVKRLAGERLDHWHYDGLI